MAMTWKSSAFSGRNVYHWYKDYCSPIFLPPSRKTRIVASFYARRLSCNSRRLSAAPICQPLRTEMMSGRSRPRRQRYHEVLKSSARPGSSLLPSRRFLARLFSQYPESKSVAQERLQRSRAHRRRSRAARPVQLPPMNCCKRAICSCAPCTDAIARHFWRIYAPHLRTDPCAILFEPRPSRPQTPRRAPRSLSNFVDVQRPTAHEFALYLSLVSGAFEARDGGTIAAPIFRPVAARSSTPSAAALRPITLACAKALKDRHRRVASHPQQTRVREPSWSGIFATPRLATPSAS